MIRKVLLLLFLLFSFSLPALAQDPPAEEKGKPDIFAIMKDEKGSVLEGILNSRPEEITVVTRDNKEKSIPSKYIKAITLEKVKREGPVSLDPSQDNKYSVRLENSQEIYTLKKKYTFSLNTNVGVVTRSIDPEAISSFLTKDAPGQAKLFDKDKPLLEDKSIVFSLEFKF